MTEDAGIPEPSSFIHPRLQWLKANSREFSKAQKRSSAASCFEDACLSSAAQCDEFFGGRRPADRAEIEVFHQLFGLELEFERARQDSRSSSRPCSRSPRRRSRAGPGEAKEPARASMSSRSFAGSGRTCRGACWPSSDRAGRSRGAPRPEIDWRHRLPGPVRRPSGERSGGVPVGAKRAAMSRSLPGTVADDRP